MKFFTKSLQVILLVTLLQQISVSQTCISIDAQVGTGASTTICSGQCATLTSSVVPVLATSSYSVGSTPYAPVSFTSGTTAIPNTDDVWSAAINIGFNFCYFGNSFNQLLIGSNGEITFDLSAAGGSEFRDITSVLPNLSEHQPNTICGPYRDTDPSSGIGSTVTYFVSGVAPCRTFVANWSNVPLFSCINPISTYQIILYEGTNIIDVNIQNSTACASWQNGRGLIGIQDATGTTAVAPTGRNVLTAWSANNEAWRFTPTGVPNYTVTWAGPSGFTATGFTATPCPTATSNYTATMNVANCSGGTSTFTSAVQVSVTPTPSITIAATPSVICRGGSSILTATGATNYTWMPGASTSNSITVSPTTTTSYSVTGANGSCVRTSSITLVVNANPTVTAVSNPGVICSSGSATLTSTGALTYTWNPGALVGNTVVVTPSATTQYTVVGTNSLGCTATRTVNTNVGTPPTITASSSFTTVCAGSTVTLSGGGGTSYTWTPGPLVGANVIVTPTANTIYTVTGRNVAGCTATNTIAINTTAGITVTATANPTLICRGGTATLTATGATSYTWMPGSIASMSIAVSPTNTTVYSVTGSSVGCTNTKTVSVTVNVPAITATKNPATLCFGNTATLTATGALTYTWQPGSTPSNTVAVTPTATIIYTVTGTNTLGCTGTRTINVAVVPTPTVNISTTAATICAGFSSTLTSSGAATYTWNPSALTGSNVVVTPTTTTIYTVTGRSVAGCSSTNTITINVNPSPVIILTASSNSICSGNTTTLTATGATTFTWNPGALTGSVVSVSPTNSTTYSVTGTSSLGCNGTSTLSISVSTINVNAISSPTILCSSNSATLTGTGALSYTWQPGASTGNTIVVTPSVTTIYTVTGTNAVGCTHTRTLNLSVGITPTVTANTSTTTICESNTITLTSGGAGTYTWMPGSLTGATVTAMPLINTTFTVHGADINGCESTNTVAITVNPTPNITTTNPPSAICAGNTVTLTASGAASYTWNPGVLTGSLVTVSPSVATVYTISATSSLNCAGSATVNVKVTASPTLVVTASPTAICSGASSTLTASGAITYTWEPGSLNGTDIVVNPTSSTIYTITGKTGDCISTETVSLNVTPAITVSASASSNTICAGQTVILTGTGANSYIWNPGAVSGNTVAVTPTITTSYTVDGDNGFGCTDTKTITITVNALPSISVSATPTLLCSSGSVTLTASGAASYTFNPGALTGSISIVNPTASTQYTVTGDNGTGCINTQTIDITVAPAFTITASTTHTVLCAGSNATLTANGAASYTWNPGTLTGATTVVTPSITTTYTVDGDNGFGCIDSETITITVNSIPTLSVAATSTALCSAASITLTASGGSTYTWSPVSATTNSVVDSPTITTTYTVSSDNGAGCIASQTITVNVGTPPSITITATPTGTICVGTTATLTASGGASYTWSPTNATTSSIADAPTVTTTYTVTSDNGFGCISTQTFVLDVAPGSAITAIANPTSTCANTTVTLSANGATTYTWLPMSVSSSSVIVTPSVSSTYTVIGDNGSCVASATVFVTISPGPLNVTSTVSGDITCITPTVNLFGNTTTAPVNYLWTGPNSYTSSLQNPTGINEGGIYTLGVVELLTGCVTTSTVAVISNTTIAGLVATTSGSLGCAASVTLTASSTTTNALTYAWSGPASFTSTVQSPTVNTIGEYTVSVSDALTGCNSTTTVSVGTTTATANFVATVSGSLTCIGDVTLTATPTSTDLVTYSWTGPTSFTSSLQSPTTNVAGDYTITVTEVASSCSATSTITVGTNTVAPNLTATTTGSLGCSSSVTITASTTETNTLTYAWSGPASYTSALQSNTVNIAGDYTVTANDAVTGCSNTVTVSVITTTASVNFTASVSGNLTCIGDVTLTATPTTTNPVTYLWTGPASFTASVQSPVTSVSGDYTITVTDVASGCSLTNTIAVGTNTVTPNLTATTSGSLGCSTSVTITATTTETNTLTYSWSGPASYTSAVQSNTVNVIGDYTVTATDALTGCSSLTIVTVGTNTDTPVVGIVNPSPALGCNTTVTLSVITAPTSTLSYLWNGPSSFTSTAQTPTTSVAGDYTLTVTDPLNGCSNIVTITIITNTLIPAYTASIIAATCSGTVANNDGIIIILGNATTDTYDLSQATTYTGTATYLTGGVIPFSGIVTNTLVNPTGLTPYTIRVFSNNGCFKDTTVMLMPTICSPTISANVLGMTKAVSTPTFVNNNAYNVTYTIVATNASTVDLTNFSVIDNLTTTFSLPTTYSIISAPVVTSLNSSLTVNAAFDGSTQNDLLMSLTSTLIAGRKDTIVFTVQINPNGFFGPFNNSAIGFGFDGTVTVSDSSNTGFNWDPDNDGDPTNNDIVTVVTLNPNSQIGVAKSGMVSQILVDKTLDVTYVITVSNLGNDTINFVQVLDSLTIPAPAQYTIKSGPTATGSLVSNANYNGVSDLGLLVASTSKLAPGQTESITIILNITPNEVKSITNIAIGAGFGYNSGIVRDSSNMGTVADPNGNGNANEVGENIPTVIELPDVNLFIPEVFTPDGDGKNDFFVIKGIEGRAVKITVFNRWGSAVYKNDEYDNTWNGSANVTSLTIGNSKLPQGTYYYIVEFADGADETINGYVVLQY